MNSGSGGWWPWYLLLSGSIMLCCCSFYCLSWILKELKNTFLDTGGFVVYSSFLWKAAVSWQPSSPWTWPKNGIPASMVVFGCLLPAFFIAGSSRSLSAGIGPRNILGANAKMAFLCRRSQAFGSRAGRLFVHNTALILKYIQRARGPGTSCAFLYSGPAISVLSTIILILWIQDLKCGWPGAEYILFAAMNHRTYHVFDL